MRVLKKLFGIETSKEDSVVRPNCPDWNTARPELVALAESPSRSSDPIWSQSLTRGGYKVKIVKGTKRMTLFRFLLAKAVYEVEGIHLDEYIVLMELYYGFLGNADPSFQKKFKSCFEETFNFFTDFARVLQFPVRIQCSEKEELLKHLNPLLPSPSAYYGLRGQRNLRLSFAVSLNEHLFPQKVKPKAFIGVGYRDKGQRRDLAKDGSPAWQEVARHYSELERRETEEEESSEMSPTPLSSKEGFG